MVTLAVLSLALTLGMCGGLIGGLLGAYLGRAAAVDAKLAPLRADIEAVADKLIHATRRWAKRDRDALESDNPPEVLERSRKLSQIWRKVKGR